MSDFVDSFFSGPKNADQPERRKEVRADLEQFVELRFDQEVFGQASTLDISSEGIRVKSAKPIEQGTSVFMMFCLPDAEAGCAEIQGEYIVLHCDPMGSEWKIGLRAYNLPQKTHDNIKAYLAHYK